MGRRKKKTVGGLLLGLALSPVAVPLYLANDILKAERKAKNKKKGRRR